MTSPKACDTAWLSGGPDDRASRRSNDESIGEFDGDSDSDRRHLTRGHD